MFNRVGVDIFSQKRGMRTRVLSAVGLLLNSCKVCMPLTITWNSWWTLVFFYPPPSTLSFVYCEQLLTAGGPRAYAISSKPDEWWAIDGQIHRLRPPLYGDLHTIVNMEVPNPRPRPISARQRLAARNRLVSQIRIRDDSVHTPLSFFSFAHFQLQNFDQFSTMWEEELVGKRLFLICNTLILEFWGRQFHKYMLFFFQPCFWKMAGIQSLCR